jgi:cyclomaltodextrinase / maltogenic alpha-amylase / neopullulanase
MELFHDSRQEECRFPTGAVPTGTQVTLRLFVTGTAFSVTLRLWNGFEKLIAMQDKGLGAFEASFTTPAEPCLMWYNFLAEDDRGHRLYFGNARDRLGGAGSAYQDPPPGFQITVYDPAFSPPAHLRDGVMYQIFPDRFHRSRMPHTDLPERILHTEWYEEPYLTHDPRSGDNWALDFYGGDLEGIRQKLPYLKGLGVTVLYLNPIFRARTNHRYDTGDYMRVDPMLGDEAALTRLCADAEDAGIRVMLDGVFSHTGEDSIYFNKHGSYPSQGAYQSKDSPYSSWYNFRRFPDDYASWWNIPTLPELNKEDPAYREFMLGKDGVARKWLRSGTAGWRLDVADELPVSFLRDLRASVRREKKDAVLLGEVWEDASNKIAYGQLRSYVLGDTLDSVMNYPLREALLGFFTHEVPAAHVVRVVRSLQENYPAPFFYSLMNLMGSHDRARILNLLVNRDYGDMPLAQRRGKTMDPPLRELARARFSRMLSVIVAMPGMPSLYYGDEAGMEGASDPFCRGPYPWGREDPVTMETVRGALRLRRERPVLRRGFLDILHEGEDTLTIIRYARDGKDPFGEPLDDDPYVLRVTRDGRRLAK